MGKKKKLLLLFLLLLIYANKYQSLTNQKM